MTTFDGFHPAWRPESTIFTPFRDQPLWLGSFYDPRSPVSHLFYSNELPTLAADGELIRWNWSRWSGVTRWFLGTPRLDHPRAFHLPFLYHRWSELRLWERPTLRRTEGISFLAGNVANGDLAAARLALAVGLARHVTVHTTRRLRHHFPSGSKVVFHEVGPTLQDKVRFVSNFDFHLAVENSRADGYLSEKPFDALWSGAVPIYAGDPGVGRWIDPEAMVDAGELEVDSVLARISAARRDGLPDHVAGQRERLVRVPLTDMMQQLWGLSARISADLDTVDPTWTNPRRLRERRAEVSGTAERIGRSGWRRAVDTFDGLPAPLKRWLPKETRGAISRGWQALWERLRR